MRTVYKNGTVYTGNGFVTDFAVENGKFCFVGEGSDKGKILALFDLLDVGIAQRKGNFRREASADRSTACESDQNNTEIFEIAQGIFCKYLHRQLVARCPVVHMGQEAVVQLERAAIIALLTNSEGMHLVLFEQAMR